MSKKSDKSLAFGDFFVLENTLRFTQSIFYVMIKSAE